MKSFFSPLVWLFALVLSSWGLSATAKADIYVTSKHLVILRSGIDTVWGSYVFAVNNSGAEPAPLRVNIMMPAEMEDFHPQEGVTREEIQLTDDGLMVEKMFNAGINVISIGFKVPARFGNAAVSFKPHMEIDSFTVLVPRESKIAVHSPVLAPGNDEARPDPQYVPYVSNTLLKSGQSFTMNVSGVPEGRMTLWITGGITGLVLLLLGLVFALRTRPRLSEAGPAALSSAI